MTKKLKEYTEPRMEVIEIKYQSQLLMVSGVLDETQPPIGPAKSHELDLDDINDLNDVFLWF